MALKDDVADGGSEIADAGSTGGSLTNIGEDIIAKFISVLEGAAILVVTYFIIRYVKAYFAKMETAHEQQRTALNLLEKITVGFILVVGITLALKVIGLDISILVSVCLLGLSYGLKDITKNYIAGILLALKSPFKVGDTVKIKQFIGKVEKMELQSTSLKTFDNRDVTVYNADILSQSVENYTRYPMRRMEINVKVGYGTDLEKAARVFDKILSNEPKILKTPKHSIVFRGFSETNMVVQLKFWLPIPSNFLKVRTSLAYKIYKAFDEANLYAPYAREAGLKEDYGMEENRKNFVKEFYSLPMFADINNPPVAPVAAQPGQPISEIIDIDDDEPSVEDF